jgi:F0F1-type ATP synthase assembly protein I
MDEPGKKDQDKKSLAEEVQASSVGTNLAACVIVGLVLGWACIHFFPRTGPWGFLIFLFLGIAAGFWQLFKSPS